MAALVRHDASVEAVLPPADAKTGADAAEIARLYNDLDRVNERDNPRTARLLACGRAKLAQNLMEEAAETALEAVRHRARGGAPLQERSPQPPPSVFVRAWYARTRAGARFADYPVR